jgi:adenylylsulfate kinase
MNTLQSCCSHNEVFLRQSAAAVWFTGLSGAGKTTIAMALHRRLAEDRFFSIILDGDDLRQGINAGLGFTPADRGENVRRAAEISRLLVNNGIICLVSTISPYPELRANARAIVGGERFIEVYVNTPLGVCEERDVKGFYSKARKNQIADFTGVQDRYVPPQSPDIEIRTDGSTVDESVDELYSQIHHRISLAQLVVGNLSSL